MSGYWADAQATGGGFFGIKSLDEQLGVDSLDPPNNTLYRMRDGFPAVRNELLLFRNGLLQDTAVPADYNEADSRTVQFLANLNNADRVLGLNVVRNRGAGGLITVDRPPALVAPLTYQTSGLFTIGDELLVWMNGLLLIEGTHYNVTLPNQFVLLFVPPPLAKFVSAIISRGNQGLSFKEVYLAQGPFPVAVPTVAVMDKNIDEVLVFINGQLQAEDLDYGLFTNNVNVTRVLPVSDVVIIGIKSSIPSKWRA